MLGLVVFVMFLLPLVVVLSLLLAVVGLGLVVNGSRCFGYARSLGDGSAAVGTAVESFVAVFAVHGFQDH